MPNQMRRGFTIVELLIVISIIVLLIALLLPMLNRAREHANQVVCANNERQILTAMFMYADSNRGVLPIPMAFSQHSPYPGMGSSNIYGIPVNCDAILMTDTGQYNWESGAFWQYIGSADPLVRRRLFNCPSDPQPQFTWGNERSHSNVGARPRNFSYNFNQELFLSTRRAIQSAISGGPQVSPVGAAGVRLSQITGATHKILIVEEAAPWDEASDLFGYLIEVNWLDHPLTTTRHSGFANIGMADGHVEPFGPDELPPTNRLLSIGQALVTQNDKWSYYCQLWH